MSWFEQLKMIPVNKPMLGLVIASSKQMEKAIEEIQNLKTPPQKLKEILRQAEMGNISIEELHNVYSKPPLGDQTIEQMKENVQKLKDAASFMTIDDVRELLREAMEAKRDEDEQKVNEILENIEQNADLSKRTLERNRDVRDALDILREKAGKSVIMFENPPTNEQLLADFADAIGGELKEGSILTDLKDNGELVALMVPKRSKKTKEIIDSDAVIQQKERVKETYNKIMRNSDGSKTNTKMLFVSGSETVEVDDLVRQKKIFVASKERKTIVEPFTGASVVKYIRAVNKIPGSIEAFKPKTFENGASFANVIFLAKSSTKSMNVNPFVQIILTNEFPNEWEKPFFDALRIQQNLTEEQATEQIIDEIYQALVDGQQRTRSDFRVRPFRIENVNTKSRKKVTAEIRNIIKESDSLETSISQAALEKQRESLQFLEGNFSIKEASAYENYLKQSGLERVPAGDDYPEPDFDEYSIEYFKDGKPTAFIAPDLDKDGNKQYDESGQLLTVEQDGKRDANYAIFNVEGEVMTPEKAVKEAGKVKTAETSDKQRERAEKTIAGLKKKLVAARKQRASAQKEESKQRADEKIKNLEQRLEEAEKRTGERQQIDMTQQLAVLREELLNMDNFEQYLLSTSKKLSSQGGLLGLADEMANKATALESITPERSLSFFAQVDELAGNEEVREAFKTIDDNPDSQEAEDAARELNEKMPSIISNIKESIIVAFKNRLEEFVNKPQNFPDNKVIVANTQFQKVGIIKDAGDEEE
jgi:hypothetical protein|tara:strand:+ start:1262 stop:3550 length:2289 start_codon:yes stop_codon:yes gene_type:complete